MDPADRSAGLLRWQWALYPDGHRARSNLLIHALSAPLFLAGSCALVASPLAGGWFAVAGGGGMLAALLAQGRGHRSEVTRPVPFRSPFDFVARFFVEQWVTFPRYVLSGNFARAWRGGAPGLHGS